MMAPIAIEPPSALGPELSASECPAQLEQHSRFFRFHDEYVLGARLEILINAPSAVLAKNAALAARAEIRRLNRTLNHRDSGSELAALNRLRSMGVSSDVFAVVRIAETWRLLTRGAFDGRLGALLDLWQAESEPNAASIAHVLAAIAGASAKLDAINRSVALSPGAMLSLDAVAKGYIVDMALTAARSSAPAIQGIAIGIGGDIRCWGEAPGCRGWRIGIPDPRIPAVNAPLADAVVLRNRAIATSGRGPRDWLGDRARSTTISPLNGYPVGDVMSASVVASHAADADAIATACMVMNPRASLALVNRLEGVAARIVDAQERVHVSAAWPTLQLAASSPEEHLLTRRAQHSSLPDALRWPRDWVLSINYVAPPRQEERERSVDFRTPYMALWITDANNRPVRTVFMVGTEAKWHRDNFVWWALHRSRADKLVELRSEATALSGRYPMYWSGVDDEWKSVPLGKYTLHLETSQERGKHHHRSITIELARERFKTELPNVPGSGGIEIIYGHPDDRYGMN